MSKRKIFGVPFPVLAALAGVIIVLVIVGLLAGPIGQAVLHLHFPSWMVVAQPSPKLPSEAVFHVLGLPVTNTLLASWITVLFLVLVSYFVTRNMKLIPKRVQSIFEFILGWIYDVCQSSAGEENGRKFFPVVCTIALYVAFNAWLSLIPGFGSILVHSADGQTFELFRNANTDINTPLAIALISFVFVEYNALKSLGPGYLKKFFNFGHFFHSIGQIFKKKFSFINMFSSLIEIVVGLLEGISELMRNVSFTFRLFGNMTAGEILVLVVAFLAPMGLNWAVYVLELLIGFIQALVFSILTLGFASVAITSHEPEAHAAES
ncbi:MAG TPA: F0F1 ATP synthase subunit A [Dehalococcoidales bacterium]|nr:F0F1 ATP synthase subunit A [Dehalococcoidales bacterium]